MRSSFQVMFAVLVFGVLGIFFFFGQPVFAGGTIVLKCGQTSIHKEIKDVYTVCERDGSALPGDIVLIEGGGYAISTLQTPVVLDQYAELISGDRRYKVKMLPLPPATPTYDTSNGEFKANIVVPLETPAEDYTLEFKVTQRACNFSMGVPCIVDVASARLNVLPSAARDNLRFTCNSGAVPCRRGDAFTFAASLLPTSNKQSVFFYLKKDGLYSNYGYALTNGHTAQITGEINVFPGTYTTVIRNTPTGVKMANSWEKEGSSVTVVAPPAPPAPPPPPPTPQPPQPPKDSTKTYKNKLTITPRIAGNEDVTIRGEDFKPGAWIQNLFIGGESFSIPRIPIKNDGTFSLTVHLPERVDVFAKINDMTIFWQQGMQMPIEFKLYVYEKIYNKDLYNSAAYVKSSVEILCPLPEVPILSFRTPFPLKQKGKIAFDASGFTCRDQLTVTFSGGRFDGKPIVGVHTMTNTDDTPFKRYSAYSLHTDEFGKTFSFEPLEFNQQVFFDPDIKEILMTVSDRHGRTASKIIPVVHPLHAFSIRVENSVGFGREKLTWKGFKFNPKSRLILENEKLLGKNKSLLLGSYNLDNRDLDENDQPFITFIVPDTAPAGDYTLRMKQNDDAYATTLYTVRRAGAEKEKKEDQKKEENPDINKDNGNEDANKQQLIENPCTNLIGYMLRQCQQAYGIAGEKNKQANEKEEKKEEQTCKNLTGYLLNQCRIAYGIPLEDQAMTEKKEEQKPIPATDTPCKGLTGYMLGQCKIAYGIADDAIRSKKEEQKVDSRLCENLEGYMLKTCQEAYGIAITEEKPQAAKKDEVPAKKIKPIEKKNPCKNLEGYLLRSCQGAYGISSQIIPTKNSPAPKIEPKKNEDSNCRGLEGYMLKQCEQAYGVSASVEIMPTPPSASEEKNTASSSPCNPDIPKIWQPGCSAVQSNDPIQTPAIPQNVERQSTPVQKYCNPDLPSIWQEGCIPAPAEQLVPKEAALCNPNIPSYAQSCCRKE